MIKKAFVIKTLAPISFTEKGGDAILFETKKYIPGNALRGAIVKKYLENKSADTDEFFDLFLSGKVCFLPAYPIGKLEAETVEPMVLPLSIMKDKQDKEYADIAYEPVTKSGFKGVNGFACRRQDGKLIKVNTKVQLEFHMSRGSEQERISGKSEKETSKVFNYEYIEPGQCFKGYIFYDEKLAALVESNILSNLEGDIFLGRSKNAQYGKGNLRLLAKISDEKECSGKNKSYLLAYTPYISYAPWQSVGEVARVILQELEEASGIKLLSADGQIPEVYAKTEDIGGYVGVWQTKRETITALSPGSLIALPVEKLNKAKIKKLKEVLWQGLGTRTEEGYGQFRIWEADGQLDLVGAVEPNKTVGVALQPNVKKQVKLILHERVKQELLTKANKDAEKVAADLMSTKSIFKHIETLMGSSKTKAEIQQAIANYKEIAKENLSKVKIDTLSIYEQLLDNVVGEESKQPYGRIDWDRRVLDGKMAQLVELMEEESKTLLPDEDYLYKTYWFWFVRHLGKKLDVSKEKEAEKNEQ